MEKLNLNKKTKTIAFISIFAALYAVIKLIPIGSMIGLSGTFSIADCLAPIYGILLGPYIGGSSIIVGTFLSFALGRPINFIGLDFLPALINTVAIGFLIRKKWIHTIILNIALLSIFLANPLTVWFYNINFGTSTVTIPFFWLHLVALAVLISPIGYKAAGWTRALKPIVIIAGIAILAFIGTMMQHLTGNILTEVIRVQLTGVVPTESLATIVWPTVFIVYPWERLTLVIISVVIGVPLIKALKTTIHPFEEKEKQTSPPLTTTTN
jgi:hypothetical protein